MHDTASPACLGYRSPECLGYALATDHQSLMHQLVVLFDHVDLSFGAVDDISCPGCLSCTGNPQCIFFSFTVVYIVVSYQDKYMSATYHVLTIFHLAWNVSA